MSASYAKAKKVNNLDYSIEDTNTNILNTLIFITRGIK